jgi:hypothetical protein
MASRNEKPSTSSAKTNEMARFQVPKLDEPIGSITYPNRSVTLVGNSRF